MAGDVAQRAVVVAVAVEIVAVEQRRQRAFQGQDGQPMLGQAQIADNVRAQQADDVGENGVLEAGVNLLGDRLILSSPIPSAGESFLLLSREV